MSDQRGTRRRVAIALAVTLAVNALLVLGLELINRPSPVSPEQAMHSRVQVVRLDEPRVAPEPPAPEPEPAEHDPLPQPDVQVELPQPMLEPLDLPVPSLDVTVPVPPAPVRQAETSPQATEATPTQAVQPSTMREEQVDVAPRPIRNPQPPYPAAAQRRGIEGHVSVELLVDVQGRVAELRVDERRGPPSFERAVQQTVVNEWAFEPGQYRGQTVPTWTSVRVDFRIGGGR